MSITDMRTESQQMLERIDDRFLAAIHAMLLAYEEPPTKTVFGYDEDGKELDAGEMRKIYAAEVAGVKEGKYLTIEDFEKESAQW